MSRDSVDRIYGHPVAVGLSSDGKDYIEQIQFVDGVPWGWKIGRIVVHCALDNWTFFLWEFVGFPFELLNSEYPEYVYYVIYDDSNNVVKVIPQDSPEGRKIAALPWSAPRQEYYAYARKPTVNRPSLEDRIALGRKVSSDHHKMSKTAKDKKVAMPIAGDKYHKTEKGSVKVNADNGDGTSLESMLKDGLISQDEYNRLKTERK